MVSGTGRFDKNRIYIDLERTLGDIDPHIFGGFAELLGHVIYGGIYDPLSATEAFTVLPCDSDFSIVPSVSYRHLSQELYRYHLIPFQYLHSLRFTDQAVRFRHRS